MKKAKLLAAIAVMCPLFTGNAFADMSGGMYGGVHANTMSFTASHRDIDGVGNDYSGDGTGFGFVLGHHQPFGRAFVDLAFSYDFMNVSDGDSTTFYYDATDPGHTNPITLKDTMSIKYVTGLSLDLGYFLTNHLYAAATIEAVSLGVDLDGDMSSPLNGTKHYSASETAKGTVTGLKLGLMLDSNSRISLGVERMDVSMDTMTARLSNNFNVPLDTTLDVNDVWKLSYEGRF